MFKLMTALYPEDGRNGNDFPNLALVFFRKIDNWYWGDGRLPMNQSLFLHVVERLEGLVGKLPATIQKPILSELTPLKELFLQQRPTRLLFTGSDKTALAEIIEMIFLPSTPFPVLVERFRWQEVTLPDRGTLSILDAREAPSSEAANIADELRRQPADGVIFIDDGESARGVRKASLDNLVRCLEWNDSAKAGAKVIAVAMLARSRKTPRDDHDEAGEERARIRGALEAQPAIRDRLLEVFGFAPGRVSAAGAKRLMSILSREVPNEARIEMIRVSRDKEAQHQVAQVLVKSTTAICTAIGAQPIPLADMPILTTLQLVMVSGIMYVSGRERSLRAATEFVGALGANLGAGMLLREGTRAILKFFPGWGNLVSGMVAGAGTYAIGRAATVFFLEGVSLKDARRTYLASRKRSARAEFPAPERPKRRRSRVK
jgi:uncharacterized protein (DUF697 family)